MLDAQGLCCPLDGSLLVNKERSLLCQQGHSFDVAKQGYCHLLPVQHKRSSDPGDSKEMVAARSALLTNGHYQPLANALADVIQQHVEQSGEEIMRLADAGCGDGYYLQQVAQACSPERAEYIGYDISKWAVLAASKRYKNARWLVASSKNIPITNDYLNILLCMFGFPVYSEFKRVLKPGGQLLLVDAGPNHLIELRQKLYQDIKPHRPWSAEQAQTQGFELVGQMLPVQFKICLPQDQLQQLLLMTPHFFRSSQQAKDELSTLAELTLTIDAQIRVLQLQGNGESCNVCC
ncbi:methyltransferase domain-containing protein [Neiella marina]|uniref:Methyltransferase domain-containing protein n=1 Tax=Neiella holothuriorum TaxID=2870530 RepID=A0ABS7EDB6_9GAMM|nr:methyltransferase domain-containing protein [Neiella holothuriorum]MBW8190214.1 methyltransferase domain-containing protein [Neiella holothuriorum]